MLFPCLVSLIIFFYQHWFFFLLPTRLPQLQWDQGSKRKAQFLTVYMMWLLMAYKKARLLGASEKGGERKVQVQRWELKFATGDSSRISVTHSVTWDSTSKDLRVKIWVWWAIPSPHLFCLWLSTLRKCLTSWMSFQRCLNSGAASWMNWNTASLMCNLTHLVQTATDGYTSVATRRRLLLSCLS